MTHIYLFIYLTNIYWAYNWTSTGLGTECIAMDRKIKSLSKWKKHSSATLSSLYVDSVNPEPKKANIINFTHTKITLCRLGWLII